MPNMRRKRRGAQPVIDECAAGNSPKMSLSQPERGAARGFCGKDRRLWREDGETGS